MVHAARVTLAVLLCAGASSYPVARNLLAPAGKVERVRLVPHFTAGQTLHYQFDIRTSTITHTAGPIVNSEAPSQLELSATAVVRLDVLRVEGDAPGEKPGRLRMRTTYEKASASSHGDAYDPTESSTEDQYKKLEGHSIEFTIEPDGSLGEVTGLKEILPDEAAGNAMRDWLSGLAMGASLPKEGIAVGQKWSAEHPVKDVPLAGIVWRAESTFVRKEPCRPGAASETVASTAGPLEDTCAVILTRFQMAQRGSTRDATPEDYRRNGLRTSGKWTGSGETLNYISLRTGLVVSVTQTGKEEMDFTVATEDGDSRVHYAGRIESRSLITLLPEASSSAQ